MSVISDDDLRQRLAIIAEGDSEFGGAEILKELLRRRLVRDLNPRQPFEDLQITPSGVRFLNS